MVHFHLSNKLKVTCFSAPVITKNLLRKSVCILLAIKRCSYALTAFSIAKVISQIIAIISLPTVSSYKSVKKNLLIIKISYLKIRASILLLVILTVTSSSTRHTFEEKKNESMRILIPSLRVLLQTSMILELNSRKSFVDIQILIRVYVIN